MSEAAFPTSPARRRSMPLSMTITGTGITGTLVLVLGLLLGVRGWNVAVLGLAMLTAFVAMLPLLFDASRRPEQRQLLMAAVAFAHLVFFVGPVFTQYFWTDPTRLGPFDLHGRHPRDIVAAQIAALSGLICIIAGFHLPLGRPLSRALPKLKPEWSHGTTLIVAMVMIPVGWSLFLGGQFGLIPRRAGTGFVGVLGTSFYFGIALLTFCHIRHRSMPALVLLLLVIPPTMGFNFFTGSKRLFLTPLFMVALAYMIVERRIRISIFVGGIALLILIYPIAQFHREVVQHGYRINAVQVLQNPGKAMSQLSGFVASMDAGEYLRYGLRAAGGRVNALGVLSTIVHDTPSRVPYQGGWSIGYAFLGFIPRVLWPGKPTLTPGQWVTDNYGGGPEIRSNTGPSWIGEFYFNFGYPGVILGMLLLGIWFRLLQEHFFGPDATIPALLLASAIVYTSAVFVGGGLIAPIAGAFFYLVPIGFTHLVIQVLSPPPGRPMPAHTDAVSSIPQQQ